MRYLFLFLIYSVLSLWVFIGLVYGYDSIINDFQTNRQFQYEEHMRELWSFVCWIVVPYFIMYFLLFLYKKSKIFNYLCFASSCSLIFFSIKLIKDQYYYNYVRIGELNQFNDLREMYGEWVNLFYIFPLFFSIINLLMSVYYFFKHILCKL